MTLAASPFGSATIAGHQIKPFDGMATTGAVQAEAGAPDNSARSVTGLSPSRRSRVSENRTLTLVPDQAPSAFPFSAHTQKVEA